MSDARWHLEACQPENIRKLLRNIEIHAKLHASWYQQQELLSRHLTWVHHSNGVWAQHEKDYRHEVISMWCMSRKAFMCWSTVLSFWSHDHALMRTIWFIEDMSINEWPVSLAFPLFHPGNTGIGIHWQWLALNVHIRPIHPWKTSTFFDT